MDFDFRLAIGGKEFADVSQGLNTVANSWTTSVARTTPQFQQELRAHLQVVAKQVAARHSGSTTTETSLASRTGEGVRSIEKGVVVTGGALGATVAAFLVAPHLVIHETGGVLKPRTGKYLTMPLKAAKNPDGTPKYLHARQWLNTFVGRSRKGNLLIFQKRGRRIVPLYLLLESIRIKPRLGLRQAVATASLERFIEKTAKNLMGEMSRV